MATMTLEEAAELAEIRAERAACAARADRVAAIAARQALGSCSAKGCYSGDRCAPCRLALGDACEACGAPGEAVGGMFGEVVLCASCKATEEGGA